MRLEYEPSVPFYFFRGMNHDPKYFPDSDEFRPERHLDTNGCLADPIPDTHGLSHGSFGSGRR